MTKDSHKPKIRELLDFFTVQDKNEKLVCIRDPAGIAPDAVFIPLHSFFLVSLMDGSNTIKDMQNLFEKQFNAPLESQQITEFIQSLENKGFLDGPIFQEKLDQALSQYRSMESRPASHAGGAYPEDKIGLTGFLDQSLKALKKSKPPGLVKGIVAPHIDLHRGAHVYARAYQSCAHRPPPHTAILLGTAHFSDTGPFILTNKSFETPLGVTDANHEFCETLIKHNSADICDGELVHLSEHSIEFQVLYLQHLFGPENLQIVPILCTSILEMVKPGDSVCLALPFVQEFIHSLEMAIQDCPGDVLIVAGADMCHVGAKFGAEQPLNKDVLNQVQKEDLHALEAAAAGDGESFFERLARIQNRNNVCSATSIYILLKLLEKAQGKLICYDMAVEEETDSAVGFAALNFF